MHLIPTQEEVVALLRETGALRDGHFEYPSGCTPTSTCRCRWPCATTSMSAC